MKMQSLFAAFLLTLSSSFAATPVASITEEFVDADSADAALAQWANNANTSSVLRVSGTSYTWRGYAFKYTGGANSACQIRVLNAAPGSSVVRFKEKAAQPNSRIWSRFDTTTAITEPDATVSVNQTNNFNVASVSVDASAATAGCKIAVLDNPHGSALEAAVLIHTSEGWFQSSSKAVPASGDLVFEFGGANAVTWQLCDPADAGTTKMEAMIDQTEQNLVLIAGTPSSLSAIDGVGLVITAAPALADIAVGENFDFDSISILPDVTAASSVSDWAVME